jgi:hypothetical protein
MAVPTFTGMYLLYQTGLRCYVVRFIWNGSSRLYNLTYLDIRIILSFKLLAGRKYWSRDHTRSTALDASSLRQK